MLTRREVLSGTAAASVAAIASAHGAAPVAAAGLDSCSLANNDGALASFVKLDTAFGAFMKWGSNVGAEVFYKEAPAGGVDAFIKFWQKGWGPLSTTSLDKLGSLQGAEAYFVKLDMDGAAFFIKGDNNVSIVTSFFIKGENGSPQVSISEIGSDGEIFNRG